MNKHNEPLWENNDIQFPRLLSEIFACSENLEIDAIADSMDVETNDVIELFDRAQSVFANIKRFL